jgi:hypothetical protein
VQRFIWTLRLQISPLKDSTNAINELRKWHNHVSGDISQLKRNLDHDPVACGKNSHTRASHGLNKLAGSYADSLVQRMESEVCCRLCPAARADIAPR